ncbi:hypothetical protein AVEN_77223-1 [Araneus ventricosus]|uniref:Uncharacterized protein n=1 Tax=Araneus ventricosus TaxID=182803 RepID=A0A4Y2WIN4_ARAVE|nr:hypothetical protein AVEN_77223-1 [Araneus ventricosus]
MTSTLDSLGQNPLLEDPSLSILRKVGQTDPPLTTDTPSHYVALVTPGGKRKTCRRKLSGLTLIWNFSFPRQSRVCRYERKKVHSDISGVTLGGLNLNFVQIYESLLAT